VRDLARAAATGEGRPARAVAAARQWLAGRAGIDAGRVGLVGLCITGGFALAIGAGWPVVSSSYGLPPPAEKLRGIGAAIVCYGGRDRLFARHAAPLREALAAAGVPSEVHVFPTVGHSFLTDGRHPVLFALGRPLMAIRHDPAVAEEAWAKIFAFFDRHLPVIAP
jgi:carboxymethylenebutenolidase